MQDDTTNSQRHFFYQPERASIRELTGFTEESAQPTMNDKVSQGLEDHQEPYCDDEGPGGEEKKIDLEDHEPYRDDEDAGGDGFAETTMKPMAVSTGYNSNSNHTQRKACFAAGLSVVFLVLGYWITYVHVSEPAVRGKGQSHSLAPNKKHKKQQTTKAPIVSACITEGFDAAYFNDLLDRIENSPQDALCDTDLNLHECHCKNPFFPIVQDNRAGWDKVVDANIRLMEKNYTSRNQQPEVVIYGDSMTENMLGRSAGKEMENFQELFPITVELLTKRGGGHINGLPMGIAADQMAHLLYRLQNGEMPEELRPRFWWLLIGTNDIGMGCAIDTVVAGNIRMVKEIREQHNNQQHHKTLTPVVINSILPRGNVGLHDDASPYQRIAPVNHQLECYAEITEGVHFVNATDLLTIERAGETVLNSSLFMNDNFHLSAAGMRQWEEMIVSTVMQFMT